MHDEGVYFFSFHINELINELDLPNFKAFQYIKLGRSKDVFKRINSELKQTMSIKSTLKDDEVSVWQTDDSIKAESLMKQIIKEIAIEDEMQPLSVTDNNRKEIYKMTDKQIKRFHSKFEHQIIQNKLIVRKVTDFHAHEINITKSDKVIPCLIENFDKIKEFSFKIGKHIKNAQKDNITSRVNKITSIKIKDIIKIKNNKIKFINIKKDDNKNYTITDFKWDLNHTFISNELINIETNKTIDLLTYKLEIESESLTDSDIDSEYNPETDSNRDSDSNFDMISINSFESLNYNDKQNIRKCINEQIEFTDKLNENMLKLGLQEFQIKSDGNCQFSAVAHQLFSNPERHTEIRRKVCHQLYEKADSYKDFCCNDETNYYTWVQSMSSNGVWGDHLTLQAIADAYHVNISIITSFENQSILHINTKQQINGIQPKVITLIFKPEIHYSSVEPINNSECLAVNILT